MKQLQTDTAVEKLEEQRKMFMSKLEELETTLTQKHHEVRQPALVQQTDEHLASSQLLILMSKCLPLFYSSSVLLPEKHEGTTLGYHLVHLPGLSG